MRKKKKQISMEANRFKNVSELIKSFEEYSGFSIDPEEIDTSEIQDYLSNEVSDICSQYYYEAGQLMPEDED